LHGPERIILRLKCPVQGRAFEEQDWGHRDPMGLPIRGSALGHEHALSRPRPSVRCRFSQRTFAQRRWGVGEAPFPVIALHIAGNRLTPRGELPSLADVSTRTARPVNNTVFAFGPFRLHTAERLLLREDKPVRLGSRAFDTLIALIERAGETVL